MIIKNILIGIFIGIGFIIPGVSGGVIATILGNYDEIVFRINHFFNNIKQNSLFLFPILLGIILSIILFSNIIIFLLKTKKILISYLFMGLITGSIPYLIKKLKSKTKKGISLIPFFISFSFGIFLFIISKLSLLFTPKPSIMILAGFLYASGKIIPGVSGTSLLILIGAYEYFLNIITNPLLTDIKLLTPFIISFIISAIIILRMMEYLFKYYFRTTYSIIIGFIISSILFIYPNYFSIFYLLVMIIGFNISYNLS